MNRLLTLASTGLFAAGFAILPVSVFAQPGAATGTASKTELKTDLKTGTAAPVAGHDGKTAPMAHGSSTAVPTHGAKAMHVDKAPANEKAAATDAVKDKTVTTGTGKTGTVSTGTPAKIGG